MNHLRPFLFIAFLIPLLLISAAEAAEIRMGSYEYDYGKAVESTINGEVFVICENCPARHRLALKPRTILLAIRKSEAQLVKTNTADIPGKRSGSEPPMEHASVTRTVRATCVDHKCLPVVYFRLDHFDLSDYEKDQLDHLVSCIKADSAKESLKVRITGHTCNLGSMVHNNQLSLMRAKSVAAYLERNGFNVSEVKGEGMSHPLSKIRKLNRRVEINIVH